MKMPQLNRK